MLALLVVNAIELFYIYRIHGQLLKTEKQLKDAISLIINELDRSVLDLEKTFNQFSAQVNSSVDALKASITELFQSYLPLLVVDKEFERFYAALATLYLDESTIPISIRLSSLEAESKDESGRLWFDSLLAQNQTDELRMVAGILLGGINISNDLVDPLIDQGFFKKAREILKNYGDEAFKILRKMVEDQE